MSVDVFKNASLDASGELAVNVHQDFPYNILQPQLEDLTTLEVPTRGTVETLRFKNVGCCTTTIRSVEIHASNKKLWEENFSLESNSNREILPSQDAFRDGYSINLKPNASRALWKTFLPYRDIDPHDTLEAKIEIEVEGGRYAEISQRFNIKFHPSFIIVLTSLILGAATSSSISLHLTRTKSTDSTSRHANQNAANSTTKAHPDTDPRAEQANDKADPERSGNTKTPSVERFHNSKLLAKRIGLSIFVATVFLILFLLVGGSVRFLNFELDPNQPIPAFLLGLYVGRRPKFWYERLVQGDDANHGGDNEKEEERRLGRDAILLGTILLATAFLSPPATAKSWDRFRPVSISYAEQANCIIILSSRESAIYRLDIATGALYKYVDLERRGSLMDMTTYKEDGVEKFAAVSIIAIGSFSKNVIFIGNVEPEAGSMEEDIQIFTAGSTARLRSISYDNNSRKFIASDLGKPILYSVALDVAKSSLEIDTILYDSMIGKAISVAAYAGHAFISVPGALWKVDIGLGDVHVVDRSIGRTAGLAVSHDGTQMIMVNLDDQDVYAYDLMTETARKILHDPSIREPREAVLDRSSYSSRSASIGSSSPL